MDLNAIIDDVNNQSPYKVMPHIDEASLFFNTDNGLIYSVTFVKEYGYAKEFDNNAYHIMFKEAYDRKDKHDVKIKQTIITIAKCFVTNNNNLILFICDAMDNREKARSMLFDKWFKEENHSFQYFKYNKALEFPDGTIYFSFLCNNNNPYKEKAIQIFDESFS